MFGTKANTTERRQYLLSEVLQGDLSIMSIVIIKMKTAGNHNGQKIPGCQNSKIIYKKNYNL